MRSHLPLAMQVMANEDIFLIGYNFLSTEVMLTKCVSGKNFYMSLCGMIIRT